MTIESLTDNLVSQLLSFSVETVLLGGSVLRGDYLSLSDLDLYLRMEKLSDEPLEDYYWIAKEIRWPSLDEIHDAGIGGIQIRFVDEKTLWPCDSLKVLSGKDWLPQWSTDEALRDAAREGFYRFCGVRYYYEYLLHTGVDWAIRLPRLVMIDVFLLLRQMLIVRGENPTQVWQLSKTEVINETIFDIPSLMGYWELLTKIDPRHPDTNLGLQCALWGIRVLGEIEEVKWHVKQDNPC